MISLTIEIPDDQNAALAAKAHARGVSTDALLREAIDKILEPEQPKKPKKSAYGLLAKYGPGPTAEEIDENRREMFRGFAKDF
jgi:plasmid stability protein